MIARSWSAGVLALVVTPPVDCLALCRLLLRLRCQEGVLMSYRRLLCTTSGTLLDAGLLIFAFISAFEIRFEGSVPRPYQWVIWHWLPLILTMQCTFLLVLGIPRLTWRYVSLFEARRIAVALSFPSLGLLIWRVATIRLGERHTMPQHMQIPISVILMDLIFSVLGLGAVRVLTRLWNERHERRLRGQGIGRPVPTLLLGAGRRGAAIARELTEHPEVRIRPVGFLDDDPGKQGSIIQGVRVLGTLRQLKAIARRLHARQALLTMAAGTGPELLRIIEACEDAGLSIKTVPALQEIVNGQSRLAGLRGLAVEDLLPRPPALAGIKEHASVFRDRVALVTGAGGSIGAELCRELCRCGTTALILVEQAENNLFQVHRHLVADFPGLHLVPCVADICDRIRMEKVLAAHRPQLVFHAAAHKHVPLMEWNPGEAIKNNVLGTRLLADLAAAHQVERFVMISTDKAVNPTSIMGVSKRVAELYIQALSRRSETRFVAVRFGNVWASAGSVVPIFQEQIAKGGPVTVTHPDMTRYFMSIPEACQLVLQAAALGAGGEIFILDMGQPVKIVDVARQMIRMACLVPDVDIKVQFTGMRPGEKLYEELSLTDENTEPTAHPRILKGRLKPYDWEQINQHIEELEHLADSGDAGRIHTKLKDIVPEYRGGPSRPAARPLPLDLPTPTATMEIQSCT